MFQASSPCIAGSVDEEPRRNHGSMVDRCDRLERRGYAGARGRPGRDRIGYLGYAGVKSNCPGRTALGEYGIAGARSRSRITNTTGKFINQHFTLEELRLKEGENVAKAAAALASRNGFVIADLPADALLKAADASTVTNRAAETPDRTNDAAARAGLPQQCDPCRPDAFDARGRACPVLAWKQ